MIKNILKFVFLVVIIVNYSKQSFSLKIKNDSVCMLRNIEYSDEYLYSPLDEIDVFIDYENKHVYKQSKIATNEIRSNSITDPLQFLWIFKKVEWLNSTFYIQNIVASHSEFICASHIHVDKFYHRRRVYLDFINEHSLITNKKCMWTFSPIGSDASKNIYTIWNVYYREPLYAANILYKSTKTNSRAIFLWHKRPDSKQFNWHVKCEQV